MTEAADLDGRQRKRQKMNQQNDHGDGKDLWAFYDAVAQIKGEGEEPLIGPFEKLPSKKLYADYYEIIKKPIAMEVIVQKLKQREYNDIEDMRDDFTLMVNNAKRYNMPESDIYVAAKLIGKFVKTYTKPPKTIHEIMKDSLTELRDVHDNEGNSVSLVFDVLPSKREYPEYYKIIKEPKCLKLIEEKINENAYSKMSDFESDVDLMFENALFFNEPNTPIWNFAKSVKSVWQKKSERRKELAKTSVSAPTTTVKLKVGGVTPKIAMPSPSSTKIKLSFGVNAAGNVKSESAKEDLKKSDRTPTANAKAETETKKEAARADSSRRESTKIKITEEKTGKEDKHRASGVVDSDATKSKNDAEVKVDGTEAAKAQVENEKDKQLRSAEKKSAVPDAARSLQRQIQSTLSPRPPENKPQTPTSASKPPYSASSYAAHPENVWERPKYFPSLIMKVSLESSDVSGKFHLDFPTSSEFSSQIFTIQLPASCYLLTVTPTMSPILMMRPHQMTVSANGKKVPPRLSGNLQENVHGIDLLKRPYDVRLMTGINCIEVLVSAAKPEVTKNGRPTGPIGVNDMDRERLIVFALLKS